MFIRRKLVNGVTYYALVESYRQNGKVCQRVIVPLGQSSTIKEAIAKAEADIEFWTDVETKLANKHRGPTVKWCLGDRLQYAYSLDQARKMLAKEQKRLAALRSV